MKTFFEDYTENDLCDVLDEAQEIILQERNIVKMDKMTMKKKLFRRASLEAARRAKDPMFAKYVKFSKLRRLYRRQIEEKYAGKARAIVQAWLKRKQEAARKSAHK